MSDNKEYGWLNPTDKKDAEDIIISSKKTEAVMIPEKVEKRIGAISYQAGETFQIGKNAKAILNRTVPPGHILTVYIRVVIERNLV